MAGVGGKYKAYPEYKDSGVEWLGEIPEHWEVKPLKYFCSYNDDVLSELLAPDFELEYVDIGSVSATDGIKQTEVMSFSKSPSRARRKVKDGDVIVSTVRTYLEAIAPIINPPENLVVSTGFAVIRPTTGVHKKYAAYLLRAKGFIKEVVARSVGVSYPAINASELVCIKTVLPKEAEQATIANFLDHETAKIDALIEEQKTLIRLLQEKRQAVISHAVTKGLNPDAPMKDSGVEWLGEVPEHWGVAPLKRFADVLDCKHITAEFVDDGIPLAGIREVKGWSIDLSEAKRTTQKFYELLIEGGREPVMGDIIYSRNATVGEAALVIGNDVFAMGQDVCLLRSNGDFDSEYLLHQLNSPVVKLQLDSLLIGSTFKRINVEDIRNFLILSPPKEEQLEIRNSLRGKTERYDALILDAEEAIKLMQERRTALISAAVTGKIDIRDWVDPAHPSAPDRDASMHGAAHPQQKHPEATHDQTG
ncbi:restriction endonuclease subunit S [Salinisphaera sp. G21_0]|uniref:restriction endonuclease subunit S n=1 Tax=Salinisphaera sp. G21_0 TaxID=2821094 RepID=UPI001ADA5456|nr:restriction endonuclease subunit S [Salinisphaera sp. G21_0]MBO9483236.1 restriction endonuclease subunit S [Salinisphaera sp. G21_0]